MRDDVAANLHKIDLIDREPFRCFRTDLPVPMSIPFIDVERKRVSNAVRHFGVREESGLGEIAS